jgi:hypothetical protein
MKKLLTLITASFAGLVGSANAAVDWSGSGGWYFGVADGTNMPTAATDSWGSSGATLVYSLSAETGTGMSITASSSASQDIDSDTTDGGLGNSGSLTFGMDFGTLQVGNIDSQAIGDGGNVSANASTYAAIGSLPGANQGADATNYHMDGTGDGQGVKITSTINGVAFTATYSPNSVDSVWGYDADADTAGQQGGVSGSLAFTDLMEGLTLNVGANTVTNTTSGTDSGNGMGVSLSYVVSDALTLNAGGGNGDNAGEESTNMYANISYKMTADTTLALGYATADSVTGTTTDEQTLTSAKLSKDLGGGVSIYLDYANYEDNVAGTNTDGNATGVGTSVAF